MRTGATRRDAALGETDRRERSPRHHHIRPTRAQQLGDLLTHREHRIPFVEAGRSRRAGGRMPRIDGDRETAQRIRRIDQRWAAHPQHELPTTLVPDRLPAEHRLRERERDAHPIARDLIPAHATHEGVVAEDRRDLGVGLHPVQREHQRASIRLHQMRGAITRRDRDIDPLGAGRDAEPAGHPSRHRGPVGEQHEVIAVHPHIQRPVKTDAREALTPAGDLHDRAVQQHPLVSPVHDRARVHHAVRVAANRGRAA